MGLGKRKELFHASLDLHVLGSGQPSESDRRIQLILIADMSRVPIRPTEDIDEELDGGSGVAPRAPLAWQCHS